MTIIAIICFIFALHIFLQVFNTRGNCMLATILYKLIPFLIGLWLIGIGLSVLGIFHTPLTPESKIPHVEEVTTK